MEIAARRVRGAAQRGHHACGLPRAQRGAEDEERVGNEDKRTDGGQPLGRDERGPTQEPRRTRDDAELPERLHRLRHAWQALWSAGRA